MSKRDWIEVGASLLGGATIGAALMYLFDPQSGDDRRDRLADAANDYAGATGHALGGTWQHTSDGASDAYDSVSDSASRGYRGLRKSLRNFAGNLSDRAGDVSDSVSDRAGSIWSKVAGAASSVLPSKRKVNSFWDDVDDLDEDDAEEAFDATSFAGKKNVKKAIKNARHFGSHLGSHLSDYVGSMGGLLSKHASKAGKSARGLARSASKRARDAADDLDLDGGPSAGSIAGITIGAVGALALGAGLMFLLDPAQGRRRRALVRDKAVSYGNQTAQYTQRTGRHIANRAYGLAHDAGSAVSGAGSSLRDRLNSAASAVKDKMGGSGDTGTSARSASGSGSIGSAASSNPGVGPTAAGASCPTSVSGIASSSSTTPTNTF